MNERIRELEAQCWKEDWFDTDKFAKLIIQECQQALTPTLRDMISRGQACELIDQHFKESETKDAYEVIMYDISTPADTSSLGVYPSREEAEKVIIDANYGVSMVYRIVEQ